MGGKGPETSLYWACMQIVIDTTDSLKTLASVHEAEDTEDLPTTSLPGSQGKKEASSTRTLCNPGQVT